ncbi:MAG: hypothetical protein PPP58_05525 [Natronomonas sp.]
MSAEAGTGDETDRFVALYRQYIGEPDQRIDVYVGFALFFGGLAMGIVALALFAIERGRFEGSEFWLRQLAFAVGALGLPILLFGIVVLLPVNKRAGYAAAGGLVISIVAVAFFVAVYPEFWNHDSARPDYSLQGVTIYAVGIISTIAATAAALVSYHIERVSEVSDAAPGDGEKTARDSGPPGRETGPEVTDEQVERDIEEAMSATEISWGGVEKVETERLNITTDAELEGANLDQTSAETHRSEGRTVDDAVAGLQGMQGGQKRTERSGGGVDEQMAALQELKEKQQEKDAADPASSDGVVTQIKRLFSKEK